MPDKHPKRAERVTGRDISAFWTGEAGKQLPAFAEGFGRQATAIRGAAGIAIARRLAQADALGDHLRAVQEVTRAYEAGVRVFEWSPVTGSPVST